MFLAEYYLFFKIITLVFLVVFFSLVANGVSTSEPAQYEAHSIKFCIHLWQPVSKLNLSLLLNHWGEQAIQQVTHGTDEHNTRFERLNLITEGGTNAVKGKYSSLTRKLSYYLSSWILNFFFQQVAP